MDAGALPSGHLDIKDENTARSSNKKWFRLLKMSILACCLTGFGLQTSEFLDNFYKYPVVVSIEYQRMEEFPIPAFTFCSKYWYDFQQYCRRFPENCETTEYPKDFCYYQSWRCKKHATHGIWRVGSVTEENPPPWSDQRNIQWQLASTGVTASAAEVDTAKEAGAETGGAAAALNVGKEVAAGIEVFGVTGDLGLPEVIVEIERNQDETFLQNAPHDHKHNHLAVL
ncbi:hypothetical protein JTE90_009161 [Oedothorax gibbosus]|uniref:Uncharacterized protein n=1 Tax=Oedothorax gibbosus TaxID=931172 RepID=A0AAV6TU74_9ARAC|nr:hypothetical protein JTE90_009161 [Oedothorax gibbosus]